MESFFVPGGESAYERPRDDPDRHTDASVLDVFSKSTSHYKRARLPTCFLGGTKYGLQIEGTRPSEHAK